MTVRGLNRSVPRVFAARLVAVLVVALLASSALVAARAQSKGNVLNGRFDNDVSGWKSDDTLIWSRVDAEESASSGSLELRSRDSISATQCIPLPDDSLHRTVQLSVQIPNQARQGQAYARITFYSETECAASANIVPVKPGSPTAIQLGGRSGTTMAGDSWTSVKLDADRPPGAAALRIQVSAETGSQGAEAFVARFDNFVVTTSAASASQPTPTPATTKLESTAQPSSGSGESSASTASQAEASNESGFPWLGTGAAVVGALAIVGAGVALFVRRRRS